MKRSGFTLVELVVVISIIAVLMAVSFPATRSSRQQAKAALCSSNIRGLQLGLFSYETENHTFPYGFDNTRTNPPPGGPVGSMAYDGAGWWWFNYITDNSRKADAQRAAHWCPARQMNDPKIKRNVLCGNYGVNTSVCKSSDATLRDRDDFVGTPLGISDIPRPGKTLLLVDCGYSTVTWGHATDAPPFKLAPDREDTASYVPGLWINEDREISPGQEHDALYGRHPNRSVNVGFADGHVARAQADDLFVEKVDAGYINRSPLWAPR